ncbi:hypothetical protein AC578_7386 [Pseudocercospora eumusae]|uniref:Uncharacterized protein n=1 Tax=Pseudocercospora eumusae TaxID=321146 RepID=A0A139H348_9PEZI|nr:hypothetical protein AC578_7386 [Pseudocercospora eumusae]
MTSPNDKFQNSLPPCYNMDALRSGAAAVADGISSLAAGVTGTDASKQEQIHKEGIDYIKDQVNSRSTSQSASTTEQEQIHKEGTEYTKDQQQYGLPGPAGHLPVDPAFSNSGLSFKHPGEELDRLRNEQKERNQPLNTDLIRNDPASHAAAGVPDALHRPYSQNEPHGPRKGDGPHGKHET